MTTPTQDLEVRLLRKLRRLDLLIDDTDMPGECSAAMLARGRLVARLDALRPKRAARAAKLILSKVKNRKVD